MNQKNSRLQILPPTSKCGSRVIFLVVFVLATHLLAAPAPIESFNSASKVEATESKLREQTLFQVSINPEMRVKVAVGSAAPRLVQNEWRTFLVRIENESGTTAPLQIVVLNPTDAGLGTNAWLQAEVVNDAVFHTALSGQPLEYRAVRLRSLVAGRREAGISLNVGEGTQDIGFRNEAAILFQCEPARTNSPSKQQ
jgi:hypothetical protein